MDPKQCIELAKSPVGLWQLTIAALTDQIARLHDGRFGLVTLATEHPFRYVDGQHFHSRPELVIQLAGVTHFRLPEDDIRVRAGRTILTPRGVPHRERNGSENLAFCNLVFMYEDGGFTFHSAASSREGRPAESVGIVQRAFVPLKSGARLYGYLNEVCSLIESGCKAHHPAVHGLMLAHLGLLRDAISDYERPAPVYSPLVAQARQLVVQNLADPDLSVKWLAATISCSADYLSHIFRVETKGTLSRHINQERLHLAQHLLRKSTMNISEIALSCGYRDPSYFSRIFTRLTGQSPRSYRQSRT